MSLLSAPLQAFSSISRLGTVHAAARELGLTQTAVTQRLRALEHQLSTTLFTRSRKGMRLTQEGEALLRYCLAARELEGDALAGISGKGTSQTRRFTVAGPTSLMRSRIIPQCSPVLRAFPGVAAHFNITDIETRDQLLKQGECDLAVLPPEQVSREMDSKLLRPEKYVLVGSPSWKGRPLTKLLEQERIIDFDPTDGTTHAYLKTFGLLGHAQSERHFVNNNESLVELFSKGTGYGVLTTEFAREHLDRGALLLLNQGRVLENPVALAWYPRPQMPEYLDAFIQAIR